MVLVHDRPQPNPLLDYVHGFKQKDGSIPVQKLTDQLSTIGSIMTPQWQQMLKMGEREPASNLQLWTLADRYSLSLAMYRTDGFHWVVLLKTPTKTQNGYEAPIYDPMHQKNKSVVIPEKHMKEPPLFLHVASDFDIVKTINVEEEDFSMNANVTEGSNDVLTQFARLDSTCGPYDLSIPKFSGELSGLTTAKMAPLQLHDSHKCGLWCLEYALVASGIRPGSNSFKDEGLHQLGIDTGVNILTPEGKI